MNAQISTKMASRRGGARNRPEVWRIEGESVTYADIARRLGISVDNARNRMTRLRLASGPVTWARLEEIGR